MLDLVLSRGRLGDVESVVELVVVMHVFVGRGVRLEHKELGVIEIRSDAGAV
jgi:putative component of toxin-antitoxin plasmid stabilization module